MPRKPFPPDEQFQSLRGDLSIGRLGIATSMANRASAALHNSDEQPVQGPVILGDLRPEIVEVDKQSSTLMAALSMAIRSLGESQSAQAMFDDLSSYNRIPAGRTDGTKCIAETTERIKTFHLPFLKNVQVDPMVNGYSSLVERRSDAETVRSVLRHSAVVVPFNFGSVRRPGKVTWGAITGYQERVPEEQTSPADTTPSSPGQEDESFRPEADFIVAVASVALRGIQHVARDRLLEVVDSRHAQVVYRLEA